MQCYLCQDAVASVLGFYSSGGIFRALENYVLLHNITVLQLADPSPPLNSYSVMGRIGSVLFMRILMTMDINYYFVSCESIVIPQTSVSCSFDLYCV